MKSSLHISALTIGLALAAPAFAENAIEDITMQVIDLDNENPQQFVNRIELPDSLREQLQARRELSVQEAAQSTAHNENASEQQDEIRDTILQAEDAHNEPGDSDPADMHVGGDNPEVIPTEVPSDTVDGKEPVEPSLEIDPATTN